MAERILLIEDDTALQALFEKFLKYRKIEFVLVETLEDAEAALAAGVFRAVLADVEIGDGNTLGLLERCRAAGVPCVAFSSDELYRNNAKNSGAITFVEKPIMMDQLDYMLERAGLR